MGHDTAAHGEVLNGIPYEFISVSFFAGGASDVSDSAAQMADRRAAVQQLSVFCFDQQRAGYLPCGEYASYIRHRACAVAAETKVQPGDSRG